MSKLILNGNDLTINDIKRINLPKKTHISICPKAKEKMVQANDYVKEIVESGEAVYGINTGFGALADKRINKEDLSKLQYNLIRSHCTGVGNFFPKRLLEQSCSYAQTVFAQDIQE